MAPTAWPRHGCPPPRARWVRRPRRRGFVRVRSHEGVLLAPGGLRSELLTVLTLSTWPKFLSASWPIREVPVDGRGHPAEGHPRLVSAVTGITGVGCCEARPCAAHIPTLEGIRSGRGRAINHVTNGERQVRNVASSTGRRSSVGAFGIPGIEVRRGRCAFAPVVFRAARDLRAPPPPGPRLRFTLVNADSAASDIERSGSRSIFHSGASYPDALTPPTPSRGKHV